MIQVHGLPSLLERSALFAGQGRFMHMGRRFRHGGSNVEPQDLLLLLGVCAAVGLAVWGLSRLLAYREAKNCHSQRGLFRELCRAHGIGWSSRQLLWKLARCHRLERPAELFVDPLRFDAQSLPDPLRVHQDRISRLYDQVFAPADG